LVNLLRPRPLRKSAYVGLTVPVSAVGFGSQAFGDFRAILGCAIALAAIALASMALIRRSVA
jgi:hypothetical protein